MQQFAKLTACRCGTVQLYKKKRETDVIQSGGRCNLQGMDIEKHGKSHKTEKNNGKRKKKNL